MAEKTYKITEEQIDKAIRAAHNGGYWQGYRDAIEDWKKVAKNIEQLMMDMHRGDLKRELVNLMNKAEREGKDDR